MSTFKQVVNYIASYDPEFPQYIKGATQAQIDELSSLINTSAYGDKLPPAYVDFLLTMGGCMQRLNISDYNFSIEAVLNFYRDNNWLEPDDLIFIGQGPAESSLYLYVRSFNHSSAFGPCVHRYTDATNAEEFMFNRFNYIDRKANTLVELICFTVFERFEIKAKERISKSFLTDHIWQRKVDVLSGLDYILSQHGFTKCWFSSISRAYKREDIAIQIKTNENVDYIYTVGAENLDLVDTYSHLIAQYFIDFKPPIEHEDTSVKVIEIEAI